MSAFAAWRPAAESDCSAGALLPDTPPALNAHTLGLPSLVTCSPAALGSTPVSKMATTVPRPSYSGYFSRNRSAPISVLGIAPAKSCRGSTLPAAAFLGCWLGAAAAEDAMAALPALAGLAGSCAGFSRNRRCGRGARAGDCGRSGGGCGVGWLAGWGGCGLGEGGDARQEGFTGCC